VERHGIRLALISNIDGAELPYTTQNVDEIAATATYFGSDHYAQYEALVSQLRQHLSAGDFTSVVHGNAEKLFRLP